MNKPVPGKDSMRSYLSHRQPPESRGDYVFEDGRAAYFYDNILRFHGKAPEDKRLEYMLYSASKYACRLTGPGITDDMQKWLK